MFGAPGNLTRFNRCVWPHLAAALRTAGILTANDADAEDLAQEAMLKAFRSIESLRDDARAKPWLLAILRHAHLDRAHVLAHRNERSLDASGIDAAAPEPSEEFDHWGDPEATLQSFSDHDVIRALRALPPAICWTLLLVDVEGLTEADAAEILHAPKGTIKSRLHRGRQMLRNTLAPLAQDLRMLAVA
jgi:RNA polymerase sigma-70 factor (ECF subfamily)